MSKEGTISSPDAGGPCGPAEKSRRPCRILLCSLANGGAGEVEGDPERVLDLSTLPMAAPVAMALAVSDGVSGTGARTSVRSVPA